MFSHLFIEQKNKHLEKIALEYPGAVSLSYRALGDLSERQKKLLLELGIKKADRIALVLPNSPAMLSLIVSILSFASLAPLNPNYKASEFEFYLSDLRPQLLILPVGSDSPAISVAKKLGIKIIFVELETGDLIISTDLSKASFDFVSPSENDIALVLHTSGTTSRPKIVPLSQKNLLASTRNLIRTLHLDNDDVCLNLMPLFHIHSFVVSLAVLASGGRLVITPTFAVADFYSWLEKFDPSWYTAAPTMHLAIYKAAEKYPEILEKTKLKRIRSSSAPLASDLILGLEKIFQAPLLESYGMTEAALQITSNQFPPELRKPGSAGRADGPELKVINEQGETLASGEVGEVVIRGENIFSQYENNPEANQNSFIDGWFRTGDLGYLDHDNYLFITGRSKEMINKGGEKISPREIDEILMRHPAIYQAVAFAVPHSSLGEEVGVAIVLEAEQNLASHELQKFAREYLADFKVPQVVVFLDEIPKGPTGKLQRIGLYEKLKNNNMMQEKNNQATAVSDKENQLLQIWQKVLEIENLGVEDNFFEMGGDSLKLKELITQAENKGLKIELEEVLNNPTVKGLAEKIKN